MIKNSRIQTIERSTLKSWDEWLAFMDSIDAKHLDHSTIATKVYDELEGKIDSPGWWAQSVTVAYEQHIGRRIPGQQSDGTFQVSVSKSTKLSMQDLMEAWVAFAENDREVNFLMAGDVRQSGTDKRFNWRAKAKDGSTIVVSSEPKKDGFSSIVITQTALASLSAYNAAKMLWKEVLVRFVSDLNSHVNKASK